MKRVVLLLMLVAGAFAGPEAAQSRPDFSGSWIAPDAAALTIQQSGTTMTVTEGADVKTYNLDGSDRQFSKGNTQYTARARWVGSALVVATTTVSSIGTWENLEVYSLDYGPKLTVVYVGTQTTRPMMYTKTKTFEKR